MNYFLDTNICIYHLNNTYPSVHEKLMQTPTKTIKIPAMVAAELQYGAEKSNKRSFSKNVVSTFLSVYQIIPFDERAAEHYAIIRASLEREGKIIGGNDMIIAAIALSHRGILVTHNTNEFSRIDGLVLEDWVYQSTDPPKNR